MHFTTISALIKHISSKHAPGEVVTLAPDYTVSDLVRDLRAIDRAHNDEIIALRNDLAALYQWDSDAD